MRLVFADGDTVAIGRIDAANGWSESTHGLDQVYNEPVKPSVPPGDIGETSIRW